MQRRQTPSKSTVETRVDDKEENEKEPRRMKACMSSTKFMVLMILCLQNTLFTVLRRYSLGVLKEQYSKHEVLLLAEIIKILFSAYMITGTLPQGQGLGFRVSYLVKKSGKMFFLAALYGAMNILSFVSLRNIGAGMFTIFAQCKIMTTATFSSIILGRRYSTAKWRALVGLMLGVLLFSEPIWGDRKNLINSSPDANAMLGTVAVLTEVTLSGFASIYFEKVIKTDSEQMNIWERNFQLALGSFPIYLVFLIYDNGGELGYGGGWSTVAFMLSCLGAAGGLLVALSIKYGDSILKTLATTGAIVLSSVVDHFLLGGPLTPSMAIAGTQVVIAICNYTFDATPELAPAKMKVLSKHGSESGKPDEDEEQAKLLDGDERSLDD